MTASYQKWTTGDVAKLREIYPIMRSADVAAQLGRTTNTVNAMAYKLGIKKVTPIRGQNQRRAPHRAGRRVLVEALRQARFHLKAGDREGALQTIDQALDAEAGAA